MRIPFPLFLAGVLLTPALAVADGMLDASHGGNGVDAFLAPYPSGDDEIFGGTVDGDGRTVLVGRHAAAEAAVGLVFRRTPQGTADAGFGTGGYVHIASPSPDAYPYVLLRRVFERPDGRLVIAGQIQATINPGQGARAFACQLQENGAPDGGFGNGGCRTITFRAQSNVDTVADAALQLDGKLLLYGTSQATPGGESNFALMRLTLTGADDLCFGDANCEDGGLVYNQIGILSGELPSKVAVTPLGRIMISGGSAFSGETNPFVARINGNGVPDLTYGTSGVARLDGAGAGTQGVTAITLLADSTAIIASEFMSNGERLVEVNKFDADGDQVTSGFGTNGSTVLRYTDVSTFNFAPAIWAQVDGTILVAGSAASNIGAYGVFGIARLRANGTVDDRFGFAGFNTAGTDLYGPNEGESRAAGIYANAGRIWVIGDTRRQLGHARHGMVARFGADDFFIDGFESTF